MIEDVRPPAWIRLRDWQWTAVDVAVATLLTSYAFGPYPVTGVSAPAWLGQVLAVAACLPVAVRRRYPVGVTVVVLVVISVDAALGFTKVPYLAVAYVLYLVAARRSSRTTLTALAGAGIAVGIYLGTGLRDRSDVIDAVAGRFSAVSGSAVAVVAAVAMGLAVRAYRRYADGIAEQAHRRVAAQLDEAARAVTEERLRIARELHDVVAHSMSVIAVQAGVGHYLLDGQPDQARKALKVIETTSRDALVEMRHLLGVLRRENDAADAGEASRLRPSPGVRDLRELTARTAETGMMAEVVVTGHCRPLPTGIELTAYRIVQEALTNVVKHAGARHCTVSVHYGETDLAVEVSDDGSGATDRSAAPGGHGLIGMRERVGVYGGELAAGPLPGRGFRVLARIPLPDRAA